MDSSAESEDYLPQSLDYESDQSTFQILERQRALLNDFVLRKKKLIEEMQRAKEEKGGSPTQTTFKAKKQIPAKSYHSDHGSSSSTQHLRTDPAFIRSRNKPEKTKNLSFEEMETLEHQRFETEKRAKEKRLSIQKIKQKIKQKLKENRKKEDTTKTDISREGTSKEDICREDTRREGSNKNAANFNSKTKSLLPSDSASSSSSDSGSSSDLDIRKTTFKYLRNIEEAKLIPHPIFPEHRGPVLPLSQINEGFVSSAPLQGLPESWRPIIHQNNETFFFQEHTRIAVWAIPYRIPDSQNVTVTFIFVCILIDIVFYLLSYLIVFI